MQPKHEFELRRYLFPRTRVRHMVEQDVVCTFSCALTTNPRGRRNDTAHSLHCSPTLIVELCPRSHYYNVARKPKSCVRRYSKRSTVVAALDTSVLSKSGTRPKKSPTRLTDQGFCCRWKVVNDSSSDMSGRTLVHAVSTFIRIYEAYDGQAQPHISVGTLGCGNRCCERKNVFELSVE